MAIAASPLMPMGPRGWPRQAPGISADWLVLPIGAAIIVVLLLARMAWPAWRLGSTRSVRDAGAAVAAGRRARLAGRLATLGLPLTVAAGVRLALEPGQGRTAVPVRSALIGTTLSVLAVTAAFTFGANLLHLVHTPRLYGQAWDTEIDLQFQVISPAQAQQRFGTNPGVTGWTYGDHGIIGVKGQLIPAIGLAPGRGPLISPPCWPAMRRAPATRSCWAHRPCATSGCMSGSRSRSPSAGTRRRTASWAARYSRTSARAASRRPISARARRPPPRCSGRRPSPPVAWLDISSCCCVSRTARAGPRP